MAHVAPGRARAHSGGMLRGMRRSLILCSLALAGCGDNVVPDPPPAVLDGSCEGTPGRPRVLVFSRENLWTHPSNPVAQQALLDMCTTRGFSVVASRDPFVFENYLATSDVAVFALTSGPVLDTDDRRARLESWLRDGHGLVGIHSASATEPDWPFFGTALGGEFYAHYPALVTATWTSVEPDHAISAGYPVTQVRTDEWYTFEHHPDTVRGTHVLFTLDEATMPADLPEDLKMGVHPMAWTHTGYGGRTFYLGLGHTPESFREPAFLDLIAHGIEWTAGSY